jgi:putative DNA primase/helicase
MTGGDTISARFLHQEFFDFKPTHKLFLGTNYKPVIKGTDHAIWRRIRLIPFEVTIPENERDPQMLEKLCTESEGILVWAIEGCRLWNIDGLGVPPSVKKATEVYRGEMDVIAQFVEDCCETGIGQTVASCDLYSAFTDWCSKNGEHTVTKKKLNLRLKELGYEPAKVGAGKQRGLRGLSLLPAV